MSLDTKNTKRNSYCTRPSNSNRGGHESTSKRGSLKGNNNNNSNNSNNNKKNDSIDSEAISVIVRCRGRNEKEMQAKSPVIVTIPDNPDANQVSINTSQDFSFTSQVSSARVYTVDQAYGPGADQALFFKGVALPLCNEFMKGYNCTIFAYGQTGTGKTYTMSGDIVEQENEFTPDAGLVPRILCKLFESVNDDFMLRCSFVEIYNEELKDLLGNTNSSRLRIYEQKKTNANGDTNPTTIRIHGLDEFHIKTAKDGLKLLKQGMERRQTATTKMNDLSSRSHTIFTITLIQKKNQSEYQFAKMNLVDLAGSENISRSGAINERAKEAGSINQSLLTLGRVINALVDENSYIPYRESKLTRLLQDSLGGKTKTVLVANIGPAHLDLQATTSTLEYATKAKDIKNSAQIGPLVSDKVLLKELVEENYRLKLDLKATRSKEGVYLDEANYNNLMVNYKNLTSETEELRRHKESLSSQIANHLKKIETERQEKQKLLENFIEMENRLSSLGNQLSEQRSNEQELLKASKKVVEMANNDVATLIDYQSKSHRFLAKNLKECVEPLTKAIEGMISKTINNQNNEIENEKLITLSNQIVSEIDAMREEQFNLANKATEKVEEFKFLKEELNSSFNIFESTVGDSNKLIQKSTENNQGFSKYITNHLFEDSEIVNKKIKQMNTKKLEDFKKLLNNQLSTLFEDITDEASSTVINYTNNRLNARSKNWFNESTIISNNLQNTTDKLSSQFNVTSNQFVSHIDTSLGFLNYKRAKLNALTTDLSSTANKVNSTSKIQTEFIKSYENVVCREVEISSKLFDIKNDLKSLAESFKDKLCDDSLVNKNWNSINQSEKILKDIEEKMLSKRAFELALSVVPNRMRSPIKGNVSPVKKYVKSRSVSPVKRSFTDVDVGNNDKRQKMNQ